MKVDCLVVSHLARVLPQAPPQRQPALASD